MKEAYNIFVVDDVPGVATTISRHLTAAGLFNCACFTSGVTALEALEASQVDCMVADLKMPDLPGDDLQRRVSRVDEDLSFVFLTGQADVSTAVELMERGAYSLLEKPFAPEHLVRTIERAAEETRRRRNRGRRTREIRDRLNTLNDDERDVLDCIWRGLTNKDTAQELSLSLRTVDRRRSALMHKMGVSSQAELIARIAVVRDS